MGKRLARETRICAHLECGNIFEVSTTSTQKFCCVSCITRGIKRSDEFKKHRSENQIKQWQDPEYKRVQHEARLGKVGGWNSGLTKETDLRLAGQAEKMSGREQSEESNEKRRKKLKGRSYIELFGEEGAKDLIKIRSEAVKGENCHWWRGGTSKDPYPEEFRWARKGVKARDGYQCQLCEKLEITEKEELGRGFPVHHIDYDMQNCNLENLITLCCSCHGKTNANREYWTDFFRLKIREIILV
ncbi:MAG: HNH endonuclease [Firmicutes bacterium]|nr:HNH endonuclease [Bacillota bacterium]